MSTVKKPAAAQPRPGDHMLYASFDHYGTGAPRDQLILVTGADGDTVYGKPLGWADEGAAFAAGQLRPLGEAGGPDGRDDGG
jgi:hypothetical protein